MNKVLRALGASLNRENRFQNLYADGESMNPAAMYLSHALMPQQMRLHQNLSPCSWHFVTSFYDFILSLMCVRINQITACTVYDKSLGVLCLFLMKYTTCKHYLSRNITLNWFDYFIHFIVQLAATRALVKGTEISVQELPKRANQSLIIKVCRGCWNSWKLFVFYWLCVPFTAISKSDFTKISSMQHVSLFLMFLFIWVVCMHISRSFLFVCLETFELSLKSQGKQFCELKGRRLTLAQRQLYKNNYSWQKFQGT